MTGNSKITDNWCCLNIALHKTHTKYHGKRKNNSISQRKVQKVIELAEYCHLAPPHRQGPPTK